MHDVFAVPNAYWIGAFVCIFLVAYIVRLAMLGHLADRTLIKLDVAVNALVISLFLTILGILVYAYA